MYKYNTYVSAVKLSGSGSQLYVLQVNFLMSKRSADAPKLEKCYVHFAADCTICFDKVFISLTYTPGLHKWFAQFLLNVNTITSISRCNRTPTMFCLFKTLFILKRIFT